MCIRHSGTTIKNIQSQQLFFKEFSQFLMSCGEQCVTRIFDRKVGIKFVFTLINVLVLNKIGCTRKERVNLDPLQDELNKIRHQLNRIRNLLDLIGKISECLSPPVNFLTSSL